MSGEPRAPFWQLRLYVAGETPRSQMALARLRALCESPFGQDYRIEVVDLLSDPGAARADQVIIIPTTVRLSPLPRVQVVGDLADTDKLRRALGLPSQPPAR